MISWLLKMVVNGLDLKIDGTILKGKNQKVCISLCKYEGMSNFKYCNLRYRTKNNNWTPLVLRWDRHSV